MHGDGGFGACEAVLWKRIWQFERQSLEVKIVCIISVWRFMPKARELNESEGPCATRSCKQLLINRGVCVS